MLLREFNMHHETGNWELWMSHKKIVFKIALQTRPFNR